MKLIESAKQDIRKVLTELLALWFALRHRRVRWYAKLIIFLPFVYIISPIDLIPDSIVFIGQLDDLIVIRISYILLKKLIAQDVLDENRERARNFFERGERQRYKFAFVLSVVWIAVITFLIIVAIRKMRRHGLY